MAEDKSSSDVDEPFSSDDSVMDADYIQHTSETDSSGENVHHNAIKLE